MYTKEAQHHKAQFLYLNTDFTQQEIADMLDVDRKTLYNWIRENNWKRAKYAIKHAPPVLVEQYYNQLGALNNAIAEREERPYPTKEEAEIIRKLNASIKHAQGDRLSLIDNIEVFTDFACSPRAKDFKLAHEFAPLMDEYIQNKFKEGQGLDSAWHKYRADKKEDLEYEQWLSDHEKAKEEALAADNTVEENDQPQQQPVTTNREFDGEFEIIENTPEPLPVNELAVNEDAEISPSENNSEQENRSKLSTGYYTRHLEEQYKISNDKNVQRVIRGSIGITIIRSASLLWGRDDSIFFMNRT